MDNETRNAIEAYANRRIESATIRAKREIDRLRTVVIELERQLEHHSSEKSFGDFMRLSAEKNKRIEELEKHNAHLHEEIIRHKGEVIHLHHYAEGLRATLANERQERYLEDEDEDDDINESVVYIVNQNNKQHVVLSEDEQGQPLPSGWHIHLADKGGWLPNPGRDENPMPDGTRCKIHLADGEVMDTNEPECFEWSLPAPDGVIGIIHYLPYPAPFYNYGE